MSIVKGYLLRFNKNTLFYGKFLKIGYVWYVYFLVLHLFAGIQQFATWNICSVALYLLILYFEMKTFFSLSFKIENDHWKLGSAG